MNVDYALRAIARGGLPRAALEWALNHWKNISPELISRFVAFSATSEHTSSGRVEAFYAAHLCAEKQETAIFAPLCQMIAEDPDILRWLGDGVTETLPGILIQVFDGNVKALQAAIESAKGDEFARAAALSAFGYLVRSKGILSDAKAKSYLRRLGRDMTPRRESIIWIEWAACAENLGYANLRADAIRLYDEGLIPNGGFSPELFDEQIKFVRADWSGLAGFHESLILPVTSAIEAIERLTRVGGVGPEDDEEIELLEAI